MIQHLEFEDIRPYVGDEVREAIGRLSTQDVFFRALHFFFPEYSRAQLEEKIRQIDNTHDFQRQIMHKGIRRILANSSDGLSFSGFDRIESDGAYLYISNHRDIFLDSGILQILLVEHDMDTTQITFGSNLMESQLITDLGKINKMFTVYRGGSMREQYEQARRLSAYIRRVIEQEGESIWIAQRSGRTKDGYDRTQVGLINMLLASDRKHFARALTALHIVPMSISYEYEPCDYLKVRECYLSRERPYTKQPGEDLQSIISGVRDHKGRIHLALGEPLQEAKLRHIEQTYDKAERNRQLALWLDEQIDSHYRLWPTHYLAADMLSARQTYAHQYTHEDATRFEAHLARRLKQLEGVGPETELRHMLLQLYAAPVHKMEERGSR
ncbi:MAG: acyltransferase [Bacteroidetes bacterium]|nr:MAG: acyltransferase [Bacteroidota bacterium]